MDSVGRIFRRDSSDDDTPEGPPFFLFLLMLCFIGATTGALIFLRRRRQRALKQTPLPTHHRGGHHRTLTITTAPSNARGESIFVYDEKMKLIANSSGPLNSPVPEIHVTFPDEEDKAGQTKGGRVVVLRISDSGSVGMEPLHHEPLPPYQTSDAERFQSLDLERMGGLREKQTEANPRWS